MGDFLRLSQNSSEREWRYNSGKVLASHKSLLSGMAKTKEPNKEPTSTSVYWSGVWKESV